MDAIRRTSLKILRESDETEITFCVEILISIVLITCLLACVL